MINCTLSNNQLRILRTKIAKDLLTYVDNKNNFDLKDYLSGLYNQVNDATKNQNLALDYARISLPFIKQLLGVDSTLENLPEQGLDIAELYKTARLAGDDKKGFQVVVDYLGVTVNPAKNLAEVKEDLEKEEQQEYVAKKNAANSTIYQETRKPFDPVSTSMQEVLSGKPGSPRDPRMKIYSTITKAILTQGSEYPGVVGGIFVKMMRYNKIAINDTFPHVKEVIESGVDQDYIIEDYNNAFVYVLVDKNGNELRFNDKAEVTKNGTLAYYNTRFLPKRGPNKLFDVDNVNNTQTAAEVAKNLGMSLEEAREYLRSGFEQLAKAYDYIKAKEGNSIMYSIAGGSYGAIVDSNPQMVPFQTRIFKNEPLSFAFYSKDKLKPGAFSGVYVTPALSKYPVLVAPKNISEEVATNLAEMLTKSVNKTDGQPLSNKEKVDILATYILNSVKDIQYGLDKSSGAIYIKLEGQPLMLSATDAAETLKSVFLKQPDGFNRKSIIALPFANSNKNVTVFSRNPNGTFNTESVPYTTYLEQNTNMNVELDEDGELKRYNPYFTLLIDPNNGDKVLLDEKNIEEEIEETNEQKVIRLRAEEQIELRKAIPNIDDYPDTYGEEQGFMPANLYAIYKAIYDKYDAAISPLQETKPTDARAEIEKRRQEELKNYDDDGGMYDDDYGKKTRKINAKYDAELEALDGKTKTTTDTKTLGLTDAKNIFKVNPINGRPDNKAIAKSKIATKFIGFAEGIAGSSTGSYAEQAGENANTGSYSPTDVVFVSVPGKRGSAKLQKENQDKTIAEAIKAVEAGATILTDNKAYIDSSTYNTGEKRLYEAMEKAGYNYSEVTVDDQVIGTWSKGATKQPAANLPGSDTKINVYSSDKNGFQDLSNFELRPFKINIKRQSIGEMSFQSVEQAYQWMKGLYTNNYEIDPSVANAEEIIAAANAKDKEIRDKILATTDGAALRRLGKSFKNFDSSDWDVASSAIMKSLLRESFKANPEALAKLLSTGEATLTHTQDKSNWKTEFPRLLMQIRKELAGSAVTPVSPVEQKAAEVIQKIEPQQIFRRGRSSADSSALDDLMNDDDFIDKNGKNKLGIQGNLKATREQIALAKTWYENSPLRQHIPFKVMFNAINTATKNGIARWDVNGITLFKGSDYSDLYHEAWHGFTQMFLTKEDRARLYSETAKNKGSFVAFDGSTVTFKEATEEQLEEYLAEDFREYMIGKGKKVLDKTPVKKNIFQKIFEFLKSLFGKTNADDVITNGNNNSYTNELYEKLRVGDLNQFTFDQANRVFTTLNKVVTTTTPQDKTGKSKLDYETSQLIGSTVDSLFVEAISKLNGGKTNVFTTAAIRTVKGRVTVYKYVLQELTKQLENVYLDKLDMEAKGLDTQDINYELDTLSYAVKHFGKPDEVLKPTGVMKYHMETSKFMEFDDRQLTEMDKIDDSKLTIKNEFESKSGNEMSGKEKASSILLYTIRGLYAYKPDGTVRENRLGFPQLMDPNAAWNRIYNITDGSRNIQDVYNRLAEAAVDYPAIGQFLAKVGLPSNMETSSQELWTEITAILTMKRIPLMALRASFSTQMIEAVDPETGEVLMEGNKTVKEKVTTFKVTPTRAGGEYSKVGAKWDNHFAVAAPGKYITVGADNVNTLNIQAVYDNFRSTLSINNLNKVFEFMEAIGMPLENNATVRKALSNKNNPTFKAIYDVHTTILYGIVPYNNMYAGANPIIIRKPSDIVKEYKVAIDDFKVSNKLAGVSIKYNTIQNFHLTWSDDFSDTTVSNAEGENQYEKSLRGTLMNMVDNINAAETLTDLTQEGVSNADDLSMNHLSKSRNPFMKTSKMMRRLFDKNGKKIVYESDYGDVVRAQIELLNMSGTSVEITNVKGLVNESGIASSNADETTKILQDFYMMMLYGVSEATRHSDKSTTYLYRLIATDINDSKGKVLKHLIDLSLFTQRSNPEAPSKGRIEFTKDLFQHLCAEYERIQKLKDGDPAGLATVGDKTYAEVGSEFVIFDKILDETTKTKIKKARTSSLSEPVLTAEDLYKYLNDPKRVELKNSIEQQIGNYLSGQVEEFEQSLADMGFYNNPQLADQVLNKMGVRSPQALTTERREQLLKDMAEAYVANSWVHTLETTLVFYGDPALFKDEADFFKRNSGLGATGGIPRTDIYMQQYINAKLASSSEAARLGFKPKKFGKTMTSAVMQDAKTQSVYYEEYLKEAIEFETDRLTKLKASKDQIAQTIAAITKRFGEYAGMTEGDGQGWINFDAYRALLMSLKKWSPVQESIYNKIVKGEEVTEDVLKFFPVKKMQYWGALKTEGLPVLGFHKFSLMPLIPNIIKGKNLDQLQAKMLEQGIDYALLKSGSKINSLTKNGTVDKFYNDSKSNTNKTLAINEKGFEFTPNEIFMDYFKDQLEVHDHFNNKVTFSTQLRKLIEDGLMENGVPTDWKTFDFADPWERIQAWEAASKEEKMLSKNYKRLIRYEANLEALVQLKKDKLVKEIGSDMKSLLDFVKKELTRQDLSDHEIDFIDYDGITKEPKQSLDLSFSADKIEKLLVAVIQKRLINQKITGETLVQVSGVGFENANNDMRNATEEEIQNYGTNGLTFYRKKADGSTAAMKIKIALQGGFKKLLFHPDVLALAKTGITPLQALNRLIKDETWLDKPINPNQEIYSKAFAKLDSAKGDSKLFILRSELTPELLNELTPDTKDGQRIKGGEYYGIKILGDYYSHNTVKSKDGENLDIIVVDKVEDAEKQYQEYLKGGAKNFTGVSEVEPVDTNRSFVTMVAARIPVQGLNSMEFMEIFEFLPEEAGNIVILPAEIVAKSGGDFDIDKMFTMMPNISAKYKKISDKSIKAISEEFGRDVTREEINDLEEKYADLDNEEAFTDEEVMILELVDNLSEEEITVKLDKSRKSVKGIENALIKDSVGILSMPENRIKLITPNGIDILKGIANDMAFIDRGEKPGSKRSPTEIFELGRNLYKHQSNSIGKAVLGIIAVANTFNTLFARTGLVMSRERVLTYKEDGTEVYADQNLYLPHNNIDGNISLSSAYSADLSNRVADIINQMINGAVDVAKDAWIFDIQGNKEVIPSLLFMIQAGVPIDQAIYFVSQPIIKEFLGKQRLLKSKFAVPIGQEDVGLFHRIEARNEILFNKENGFTNDPSKYLNKRLRGDNPIYDKTLIWELLNESAPKLEDYSKEELKKNLKKKEGEGYNELDRAVFSQFIMIQEMAGQITQLTQALKFDNDKTSTLLDARMKLEKMDNLTNGISAESIRRISEESPISAFKIQDFIIDQYHSLFPLRDSEQVNNMVQNIFRRQGDGKNLSFGIKKTTGMDDETLQRTLRNDLMSFLFQRSYYKFNPATKSYQGKDVEVEIEDVKNLKAAARVKEGTLYVDRNQINSLFATKQYSKQSAWQFAAPVDNIVFDMYDPVTGKQLFTKFVFEREVLRSYPENSKENISTTPDYKKYLAHYKNQADEKYTPEYKAYESVLRDKALGNLNLHGHLFYGEKAYGRQIMQLKESNPDLFEKYSVLSNLEAVTKPYTTTTLTNLKFANTLYTADDLNIYHNNLQDLANPSVIKSTDTVENERISNLFQKFGLFSILQSGTDTRSTFSMVRAVPTEMSMALFEKPYKEFTEELKYDEVEQLLRDYQNTFVTSQYLRSNYLSKKIKNWATNPFLAKVADAEGNVPDNVIYNLDPEALQRSIEAAAEAERAAEEAEARNVMVGGIPVNLTQLGISFTPNDQQVEALNNIAEFISKGFDTTSKNITDNMYTLMGYAGTGKTSITKILLEYLRKRNITNDVTATTHKAKGVLSKAIGVPTKTIHNVLALAPNIDPTRVNLKKLNMSIVNDGPSPKDVLIIDESSFIGPDLFAFIKQRAEKNQQQVIFIGDPAQLKPVAKEKKNTVVLFKENSPVFREVTNKSELTQVERQAGDNPLGPILDSIRNNMKAEFPTFGYKSEIIGNQGIVFTDSGKQFAKDVVKAFQSDSFKNNRNFVRAVTYTNKRVGILNEIIRKGLGYSEPYVVGEILMGYSNFKKAYPGTTYAINNSVDYVVTNVEYVESKKVGEKALRDSGLDLQPMEMSGYNITLQDISDSKIKPVEVFMLDNNNSEEQFIELGRQSEALAAQGEIKRALFKNWYNFMDSFALNRDIVADELDPETGEPRVVVVKTLDYGYAHTIHKSQGSTYTNIFVDLDTVDISTDAEERNQMKYVALSRATNIAYAFTNKAEGVTPSIDFNNDFDSKTLVPSETNRLYKTEEDIASSKLLSILEDNVTGIRTFRYALDKTSGTPGKGVLTEETARIIRQDYPNALMIFNDFLNLKGNTAGTNSVWRALGDNGFGLSTKVGPSPTKVGSDKINMSDALTDETLDDNKEMIDEAIKDIKEYLAEPGPQKYLVFDDFGYGQYMIGYVENAPTISRPTLKGPAPQTFLHLSEQLYRNFGYINPHYLLLPQGRAVVQEGQPITDDEIIEQNNKKC
jgi:predicted NAD-dependent protein-ADP-ribosyltransferase YbiA (DUF1768 family)